MPEAERRWWAEARKPLRRRVMLRTVSMATTFALLPVVVHDPGGFLAGQWMVELPLGLAVGLVGGWGLWRMEERTLLPLHRTGKRLRDAMLAGDDEAPPEQLTTDGEQPATRDRAGVAPLPGAWHPPTRGGEHERTR
jgi:NADPH-dependent ferric siderophore reductase